MALTGGAGSMQWHTIEALDDARAKPLHGVRKSNQAFARLGHIVRGGCD